MDGLQVKTTITYKQKTKGKRKAILEKKFSRIGLKKCGSRQFFEI